MNDRQRIGILMIGLGAAGWMLGCAMFLAGMFWQLKFMSGETDCRPTWAWYECVQRSGDRTAEQHEQR